MLKSITTLVFAIGLTLFSYGQNIDTMTILPYKEIPTAPEAYSAHTVVARMIDGLGYRYYWATEGLRPIDLEFTPGNDGAKANEVLSHLYRLSKTILNGVQQQPNIRPQSSEELSFEMQRAETLDNLLQASIILKSEKNSLEDYPIVFQRGEQQSSFPFWNMINGPITDAIYHVGQIVSYRRSSGNPINPNVNVFLGKNRE